MVKALAKAGATIDLSDHLEETALHKASSGGYLEVIEYLLKVGAKPRPDMCGELPVDHALPRKAELIKALFEKYSRA